MVQGRLVSTAHSAELCVGLALSGRFQSGAHLDYYDCCGEGGAATAPRPDHNAAATTTPSTSR